MDLGNGLGHLTYSTLVHPGDTWGDMWESLTTYVPQVKQRVSPDQPFGVSLRLSAASAQTLVDDDVARERLKEFLTENDLYLYTVNAFPYGPFKGRIVKEQVYEPDWRSEERTPPPSCSGGRCAPSTEESLSLLRSGYDLERLRSGDSAQLSVAATTATHHAEA